MDKLKSLSFKSILIAGVSIYVGVHLIIGMTNIVDLKMQQKSLENDLAAAYEEKAELENELAYMTSDDAIEKNAREKLGLVRDGEILIQFVETK